LIARIGFAVGTLVALGFPTPASAQDAPPLQRPPDKTDSRFSLDLRTAAPDDPAVVTGSLRVEYVARDSAIEELRARLAGFPPSRGDDTFVAADARIRLDLRLPNLRVAAELAALPYDDGENRALGDGGGDLFLKQLFMDLEAFLSDDLTLRAGAFAYAWRIRPHGEPFLLDLGRAESFFTGPGDRDVELPAGGLLKWRAADFVEVEALWMTAIEGGAASSDETLAALMANFPLSERTAFFLGLLHVTGDESRRVTTWGGGADGYFGPDREVEVFGEAWFQSGRISSGVSRRAWGAQAGARVVEGPLKMEFAAAWRSGDDDPSDRRDGAFQSYEGQERFRIVESAEFGLDWDVNLASVRLLLSHSLGGSVEARVDAARFSLAESTPGVDRDLGTEVDVSVRWEASKAVAAWISLAALLGSDALEESTSLLAAAGVQALW
jgi:hypothetical protein